MASVTSWTRLEPRVRRDDPALALEARIHDPLWMLARQWQVGEFAGEDAGSPLQARVRLERAPVTRALTGPLPGEAVEAPSYDPGRMPLEVLVERERASFDLRLRFEVGQHLVRLLEDQGVGHCRAPLSARYPLQADPQGPPVGAETARLLRIGRGRVPDGIAAAAALRGAEDGVPTGLAIAPQDKEPVLAATAAWLAWLDHHHGPAQEGTTQPWIPQRMEYAFAVGAPASGGEAVLVASEYAQGEVEWHAFDRRPGASIGAALDEARREDLMRVAIPAPVTYRGMPVARWWEFEDGQVNFGASDGEPSNLLRLLLIDFALDYGNDWFIVPVELPADSVYRVASLVVTDSFGVGTLVRPYTSAQSAGSRWRMFCLSADGEEGVSRDDLLFLPPSVAPPLRGEPLEEVLLVRDEVANLAWAVERRVEDAGGRAYDRFEQYQRRRAAGASSEHSTLAVTSDLSEPTESTEPTESSSGLRYRLATTVPDYWVPLVPTRVDPDEPDVRLVRGRVLLEGGAEPVAPRPLGRFLEPGQPLRLFEEEVGRTGVRLSRAYRYARWTDGSLHLWVGRRKSGGRGEGASGLRFDTLEAE